MIVTALNGGLGNQLFQYALARRLAHDRGVPLRVDVNILSNPSQIRTFQLKYLEVNAVPMTDEEARKFWGWRRLRYIRKWYDLAEVRKPYYKRTLVKEKGVWFDENILKVGTHVYLQGYWQSEKYFQAIADLLRQEIRPRGPWNKENSLLLEQIRDCRAVSVHLRRGDYVDDPDINQTHGVLQSPYYEEAARIIKSKITSPHFFVFSDDVLWARENLDFHAPTFYVTYNKSEDHWDMVLMSYCSHHIIANSSFSWWGAWLNSNSEKCVIAPKRWYKAEIFNPDLLPDDWIKI